MANNRFKIFYFLKGSGYNNFFWTDGINAASNLEKVWSWSMQNFVNYGYLKVNFVNGLNNVRAFLFLNSSGLYELDDNAGTTTAPASVNGYGYACEAQGF